MFPNSRLADEEECINDIEDNVMESTQAESRKREKNCLKKF